MKRHLLPSVLSLFGGALYALAFPTKFTGPHLAAGLLGIILFLSAIRGSLTARLGRWACFSLGFTTVGLHWIPYTVEQFGALGAPWNTLILILFSLIALPHYALYACLAGRLQNIRWPDGSIPCLCLATLLTLLEAYIPQQFPIHAGQPWLQLAPWLGLAPIFGVPVFSFASYYLALEAINWWRTRNTSLAPIIFLALFGAANALIPLNPPGDGATLTSRLRLVQGNIGNFTKMHAKSGATESGDRVYQTYLAASTAPALVPPELIIWPETAIPDLLDSSDMVAPEVVKKTISLTGASLLMGGYDKAKQWKEGQTFESEHNALFLFDSQARLRQVYHKRILIPFGESLPFGPLNPHLAKFIHNVSHFARGESFGLFETENGSRFIAAICYEALFSGFVRDYLASVGQSPHYLVNLANDSWYGDSSEPWQHKFLAHWRALEFNLPIVRLTNTGVTSILYPDGSESDNLGLFRQGTLDIELITRERRPTVFERWGILPLLTLVASLILIQSLYTTVRRPHR